MKQKLVLGLLMAAIFFTWSAAGAYEKCSMCGMDAAKSETRFTAQVIEGNEKVPAGEHAFCCLRCLLTFMRRMETGQIGVLQVRDYDKHTMFDATKGFFLVESEKIPQESMVPFMLIFSDQKTANKFQEMYGGKVIGWDEVRKYVENQ